MSPVFCGQHGRADALSYAKQRAGYGRAEIQALDEAWDVIETIEKEDTRPIVRVVHKRIGQSNLNRV